MQNDDIPYRNYDHAAKMAKGYAFTIDQEGRWYCHDPAMGEGPIRREALAKLFAGAGTGWMAGKGLSIDTGGRYWLKSPHDSYAVDVEDVPFVITDYDRKAGVIILKTNFGEEVPLTQDHTFIFRSDGPFPDIPYIDVRAGLLARLNRPVFYNLAAEASEQNNELGVESGGQIHLLGKVI